MSTCVPILNLVISFLTHKSTLTGLSKLTLWAWPSASRCWSLTWRRVVCMGEHFTQSHPRCTKHPPTASIPTAAMAD